MFSKGPKQMATSTFDETALDISYQHSSTQLTEVKVNYKWTASHLKHRPPSLNCQWFNKTDESMDPIPGVTDQVYQPCILDVGTTLYLQILPSSKEMQYVGMPITKSIGPLQLSAETEEQVNELLQAQKSTYFVQVKELKLKSIQISKQSKNPSPLRQTLLKLIKNKLLLMGKLNNSEKAQSLIEVEIEKMLPILQLNRKNCKELTIKFSQEQQATLLLQNNKIRDVFYLLIKKMKQEAKQKPEQSEQPPTTQKNNLEMGSETKISSEDSLKKEENLPLSPQTQQLPKEQKETSDKPEMGQQDNLKIIKKLQTLKSLKDTFQTQNKIIKKSLLQLEEAYSSLKGEKTKAEEEACYHKNQSRLITEQLNSQKDKNRDLQSTIELLQKKSTVSLPQAEAQLKYGKRLELSTEQLLQQLLKKQQEIQELKNKNSYENEQIQSLDNQNKSLNEQIEHIKNHSRNLQKKIESLAESKKVLSQQIGSYHTHSHQIGSYEFQISKLKEQLNIIKDKQQVEEESKLKQIDFLKVQVKQLIEQNTYLRSKEKSSKGELKNQLIELKKLVNRFAESLAEKDLEIQHLKNTNKEISKELSSSSPHKL